MPTNNLPPGRITVRTFTVDGVQLLDVIRVHLNDAGGDQKARDFRPLVVMTASKQQAVALVEVNHRGEDGVEWYRKREGE